MVSVASGRSSGGIRIRRTGDQTLLIPGDTRLGARGDAVGDADLVIGDVKAAVERTRVELRSSDSAVLDGWGVDSTVSEFARANRVGGDVVCGDRVNGDLTVRAAVN